MLGAIIGDIVGSPYEFGSDKRTDFALFQPACRATDDSMMTIAVGLGLLDADLSQEYSVKRSLTYWMRRIGREYPDAGYGRMFYAWLMDDRAVPYGGYTNGSAMRVSSVAYAAEDLSHCLTLARWSAELTHSHPDGIAGAQAVASALFLARMGESKQQIEAYIEENFYPLDFTLRDIRPHYCHDMTCRGSVPQAIRCFLESTDFESALRTRCFEPDGPNWTPRISGMTNLKTGEYKLSILKSADPEGSACLRQTFEYAPLAGLGHFLHTYVGDGNPIPSFEGEPEKVTLKGDIETLALNTWQNLNNDNKVSLYVSFINLKNGETDSIIINKHEQDKE